MRTPASRIAAHVRDIPRSGIRDFFDIVSTMKDVISLGIGEPDFDTPWHIREAAINALERGSTSYTSNMGLISLRQAITRYVEKNYGVRYNAETEVLITVGVSEALDLALRAIIEPGDEILYHEPCYVSYAPVVIFAHGVPVAIETRAEDGFRLTRAQLEAKVTPRTKALMLNFPNNPTGATLDADDVREIAAFAVEHDLIVITDEIYAELTYDGRHVSIASMPGMKERTIFLHGYSKAWAMTGFRMGYACSTPELIEAMMKIHQYTMLCASIISQEAAVEALKDPDADVEEMRSEYHRRRNFLFNSFKEMGLPCHTPRGAFYAFPYIGHLGLTSKEFALRLLDQEKVAVVPGTAFGPCGEGYVRCAYATGMEDLQEAMRRLARFIRTLQPAAVTARPAVC
ncbi:MAG TPA: aminotransferase class I/II-fold pyridoxal phosphate-dependent enzyme [Kiritimatiellia bacterium]|nr:aminotransferase class I/II-fold pyridoxal phosphate-dependent enzyme [Kiritimatiellia bacterium]